MKTVACGIVILLLLTSVLSSTFIVQSVKADEAQLPSITIQSPQNKTYNVNASIPLTFIVDEFASWIGYSLNGQPNATITGNTTLPTPPDGWHHLVIYANDTSGNMKASSVRNFTVDTIAPTGSITINDGAASTIDASVTLTLSAQDATSGVAQMRFFNLAWADWEEYATSKPWTFTVGTGYKTVYVQFMDNAGLVSSPYRVTIFLGTSNPADPGVASAPSQTPETLKETPEGIEKDKAEKPPEEEIPKETLPTPSPEPPPKCIADIYFIPVIAGVIVAIVVVGVLILIVIKTIHKASNHLLFSAR